MIRKIGVVVFIIMGLMIACSTSSSDKSDQSSLAHPSNSKIAWTRFDDGLKTVSGTDKHVLAFFWRDG
jgi:hypothetical protein